MECFRTRLSLLLLLHAFLLLLSLHQVRPDEEDDLLQGINSFRQSASAPPLVKHDKADCVADEIADKIEGKSCSNTAASVQTQLVSEYPSVLKKCKVDVNTTTDGMILPVCVPRRVATLVLTNYTQSQNAKYLNDSKYTGAGVGSEDDWTVLVLTTNTQGGTFASGAHRYLTMASPYYAPSLVLFMVFGIFLY